MFLSSFLRTGIPEFEVGILEKKNFRGFCFNSGVSYFFDLQHIVII